MKLENQKNEPLTLCASAPLRETFFPKLNPLQKAEGIIKP
jgi:hypothetical protein